MKRAMRVLCLCFLFLIFAEALPSSAVAEGKPYTIGVIVPLSGDAASLGNYIRKGVIFSYDSLPASVHDRVRILFEDDQLQPAKTVSAYHKLVSTDHADAIFVTGSGSGNALGPLAERDKKLLIAVGASDKRFASGTTYVFTHWVSPESETVPLVDEVKKRGFKSIGIITSEHEGANALREAFLKELKKQDLAERIVFDEKVAMGAQDFKTLLAKARTKNVDAMCTIILPGSLATYAKQVKEVALPAEIFGYELFEDVNEVKASEGTLVGKWYVNASDPTNEFRERFKMKFGELPGFGAGNAYDSLALVAFAAAAFNGNNLLIANHLRELKDYKGAVGLYSATGDNRFALPATLKVVTADGFKKLQ